MIVQQDLSDLLCRFESKIGAADHQQRNDQGQIEAVFQPNQKQGCGKQEQELVLERPGGDFPNDRKFALRGQSYNVAGGYRRIVDDDAGRLRAGLARCAGDIVER